MSETNQPEATFPTATGTLTLNPIGINLEMSISSAPYNNLRLETGLFAGNGYVPPNKLEQYRFSGKFGPLHLNNSTWQSFFAMRSNYQLKVEEENGFLVVRFYISTGMESATFSAPCQGDLKNNTLSSGGEVYWIPSQD